MRRHVVVAWVVCALVAVPPFRGTVDVGAKPPAPLEVGTPAPCPVTIPNGDAPAGDAPSPLSHGNGDLWTTLSADGTTAILPGNVEPDGSLFLKFPWWKDVDGELTIEGRRLDAPAPPLRVHFAWNSAGSRFIPTTLIFATEGCWEVTATVGTSRLTFVTLVERTTAAAGTPIADR